jgi:hypothetical protein
MKIRQGMTSGECVENKWFNMKYIGKYLSVEILLTHECRSVIYKHGSARNDLFPAKIRSINILEAYIN